MLNEKLLRERLRQVVDQSGLTRQKFAEAVGLSTTGLGNLFLPEDASKPTLETLVRIADFTGRPVGWFLGEVDLDEDDQPESGGKPGTVTLDVGELARALTIAVREGVQPLADEVRGAVERGALRGPSRPQGDGQDAGGPAREAG